MSFLLSSGRGHLLAGVGRRRDRNPQDNAAREVFNAFIRIAGWRWAWGDVANRCQRPGPRPINAELDILPPPNAIALWRGIPGLPPGRFSVLRRRLLTRSPMGLSAPSVQFVWLHCGLGVRLGRIASNDRCASLA